jgi:hypothetical protein
LGSGAKTRKGLHRSAAKSEKKCGSAEARLAIVFAGCIGVTDVTRGENNLPLLCSPIRSAEELGGSSALIMASVVAGRDFLGARVLVRLVPDLAVFLRCLVVVVDDGLTFAAGMNIPISAHQGGLLKTWSRQELPLVLRPWPRENICAVVTSEGVEPKVDGETSPGRYHQNLHPHRNWMMEEKGPGNLPRPM